MILAKFVRIVFVGAIVAVTACSDSAGGASHAQTSADQAAGTSAPSPGIPVLMYHDIITPEYVSTVRNGTTYSSDVWLADFQQQMSWLASSGYTPISAIDLVAYVNGTAVVGDGRIPQQPVLITFDDSFDSQYSVWQNELVPRGFKATFFIITGYAQGQQTASGLHMTQDELGTMAQSPLVEIESHTVTHPDLSTLTGTALADELSNSIGALTPYASSFLAYPFGSHDDETIAAAKNWYNAAFCVGSSNALYGNDPFCIPRLGVGIWTQGALGSFTALFGSGAGAGSTVADQDPPQCEGQSTSVGRVVCDYAGLGTQFATVSSCVLGGGGGACFSNLCGDDSGGGYTCDGDALYSCVCYGGGAACLANNCQQCANPGCD